MTGEFPRGGPGREVVAAGERLADPGWLVNGDPEQVVAALDGATGREEAIAAAVYRASGHLHRGSGARVRRQVLALDAARCGDRELAGRLAAVAVGGDGGDAWAVRWATGTGVDSRLRYALPAPDEVLVVAAVVAEGRGIAVAGCGDSTLHWWDVTTGRKLGALAADPADTVRALAATVLDGRPVAVTGHAEGMVRVWDLVEGRPAAAHQGAAGSWVNSLATTVIEGRPVVASAATDGMVRLWDLASPTRSSELLGIRTGSVHALATAVLDGRPVAVTGHAEGTVRRWDLLTGRELGDAPVPEAGGSVGGGRHCATLELNARTHLVATDPASTYPLAVSANSYESHVRHLTTGEPAGEPGPGFVEAAALTTIRDRPAGLFAFSGHGPVEVWDLSTRTHLRQPLVGHEGTVRAVATAVVRGRRLAVTGGDDGSVRVWDLDGERRADRPPGHTGLVQRVTTAVVDGRTVIVTGGSDRRVRFWDLDSGEQLGEPLAGHTTAVGLITVGTVDGRPALLTRGRNDEVRLWDLATREHLHGRSTSEYASSYISLFAAVDGRFVGVTGEGRAWDLTTSRWIGVRPAHGGALALEPLEGRHVVLTGAWTDTVDLWDLATGERIGPPLSGHAGKVRAGAVGLLAGRPVVAAGGDDRTVRLWDATSGRELGTYAFPARIRGLAVAPDGRLVVGFGADLAVVAPRRPLAEPRPGPASG
ncbi:hypothetical protein PUR71_12240 [Streptomyces sp. SP17BM10]|uniref:WD40 repeat domain-containing protein n=1 Tax=Streptomyces sp. SP17BM10 TaxID=3002530 RepID=UPI002E76009E|nr:hypothetical protein [Streptomyces sp. SP17BM10]MEE1783669.1 hypothetical protein [Streptomyces sp. SP17BM10]